MCCRSWIIRWEGRPTTCRCKTDPFCDQEQGIGTRSKTTSTGTWKYCRRLPVSQDSNGRPVFSTIPCRRKLLLDVSRRLQTRNRQSNARGRGRLYTPTGKAIADYDAVTRATYDTDRRRIGTENRPAGMAEARNSAARAVVVFFSKRMTDCQSVANCGFLGLFGQICGASCGQT